MKAIQKIRDEHRSISAVLHALKQLAHDAQDRRVKPGFEAFRAMIRYIDEYPEQLHHPKEDQYLFPPLVARVPETKRLVDSLRREHEEGAHLVRELERALVFFEDAWPAGAAEFLRTVDGYAEFHWQHMRKEEQEVLPLAEKHFTGSDWQAINEAFDANQDPIAGVREKDFQDLFSRIVRLAPAPVGLGERWPKLKKAS
jgi:hemerythrin-like domain-containing protein